MFTLDSTILFISPINLNPGLACKNCSKSVTKMVDVASSLFAKLAPSIATNSEQITANKIAFDIVEALVDVHVR